MKTWLITGCSSGIGRAIAEKVLENGDNAVITARNKERLQSLADLFPKTSLPVSLEVTDMESIKNAVQSAKRRFGTIDVLVNNAGRGYSGAVEEGDNKAVAELFDTNLFGPINLMKEILPDMRGKKKFADVGITAGTELVLEAKAPFGGLLRVRVLETSMAFHSEDAKSILIGTK